MVTQSQDVPKPVREYRFSATIDGPDLTAFREALVDLAGGFTEITIERGTRYIVGLSGRGANQRVQDLLAQWAARTREGNIEIEDQASAADRDEIYFLLPLQRNPAPGGGPRLPLFTNEELAALRGDLARRFHFRPEMVRVYGEWRNKAGELVPDHSLLIRVPRRSRGTVPALRGFIRGDILAAPNCDQDCIHLSNRWRGEFIA
jgi:hypothetical protein